MVTLVYRALPQRTQALIATSLPYRETGSGGNLLRINSGVVVLSTSTAYRNLGISANLQRSVLFCITHKCKNTTFHARYSSSLKLSDRLYFMSTISNLVCFVFVTRSSLLVYSLKTCECMKTAYLLSTIK